MTYSILPSNKTTYSGPSCRPRPKALCAEAGNCGVRQSPRLSCWSSFSLWEGAGLTWGRVGCLCWLLLPGPRPRRPSAAGLRRSRKSSPCSSEGEAGDCETTPRKAELLQGRDALRLLSAHDPPHLSNAGSGSRIWSPPSTIGPSSGWARRTTSRTRAR